MKKIISVLMVALLVVASVPCGGLFADASYKKTESYNMTLEAALVDSSLCENAAAPMRSFFTLTEFDGCYGNQLSGVARELYDSLVKSYVTDKKTNEYTHIFENPYTFNAEISDGTIVRNDELEEIYLELGCAMQAATDAFRYDYPQVFWLKIIGASYSISASGNSYVGYTGTVGSITIIPTEIYSGAAEKITQYDAAVEAVLELISVTESRYDTLKGVHDYICGKAYYNLVSDYRVHTSEPVFIGDGGVVCEGYAKAFKILCDRLGIPCVLVSGYAGESHMWNYVQMDDGKWYLVDVTWDDQKSKIYDTYFLANAYTIGFDGEAINEERTERTDFSGSGMFNFTYPVLSATAYTVHVHEWGTEYTVDVEPTCTEKGSESIHCKTCQATKSVTEISAIGHRWNDGVINSVSTCKTHGTKIYTCLNDTGHKKTESVALDENNHEGGTYLKDKAKATCTSAGYTGDVYCSGCNVKLETGEAIPVKTHINKTTVTKATPSKNGSVVSACYVCGTNKSTAIINYPKTIELSATAYTYNGKTKTPSVIVKDSEGKALKKGADYTVAYSKGRKKVGRYTVTVTFKGNYSGTKKLTFEIKPKKVTLSRVTAGKKQLTAVWKTVSGVTGYEAAYSTTKKFTKKTTKVLKVKKAKTNKITIKSLKKGKRYFIRVRAYKTVKGKNIYGVWSNVKAVKIK